MGAQRIIIDITGTEISDKFGYSIIGFRTMGTKEASQSPHSFGDKTWDLDEPHGRAYSGDNVRLFNWF